MALLRSHRRSPHTRRRANQRTAASSVLLAVWLGGASAACSLVATPRLQDASAPKDYYRASQPAKTACGEDLPLLTVGQAGGRPYAELSTLSATCYPGALDACRKRLRERACELHADALIEMGPAAQGTPPGASNQSLVSMSARAVRWKDPM